VARVWRVFPFDFGGWSFDWSFLVRLVVVLATVGGAVGLLVQLVTLLWRIARILVRTPTQQH